MTKIVLIRHGQTTWNTNGKYQGRTDVPLSEEGVAQARALAEKFPLEHLDGIHASDLMRAMVTAECIGERFHLAVQPEKAFRELSFGKWEGLTYAEIVARWPEAMENFHFHPDRLEIPGGETIQELQERVTERLREIVGENEGKTVAIVAHGAVIRAAICDALSIPLHRFWSIRQFNTAVNIVSYEDGWSTVELMNSTAHLGRVD